MLNISLPLMKAPLSKKKLLGQYFSGDRIADTLYDLLGSPRNVSVIDPMCGVGHLLRPFSMDNNARILGVEIDETAENANLMTQSKGVVIVNYKELKKI